MEKTMDYSIFKFRVENRDVKKEKVEKVKESVSITDKSHMFPIIVNSEMQIMDGQHRFHALKEMGLPIYYIRDDSFSLEDMALVNSAQSHWTLSDWLKYWHSIKGEPYTTVKRISEMYSQPPSVIGSLLCGIARGDFCTMLKKGGLKLLGEERLCEIEKSLNDAEEVLDALRKSTIKSRPVFEQLSFRRALRSVLAIPGIQKDVLIEKLVSRSDQITKRPSISSHKKAIIDIYNVYNRNPIKFDEFEN